MQIGQTASFWMDVQFCGALHGQHQAQLIKLKLHTMWNLLNSICSNGSVWVMSTLYLTDTSTLVLSTQHEMPGALVAVEYQLSITAPLPPQKQVLTVSENKKQLIQIIVETLVSDEVIQEGCKSKLVTTGQDYTPIEIAQNGLVIRRQDLKTTHEEADTIIVAQAIYAAKEERKNVVVVADDTDVYILLLYYYHAKSLAIPMKLQSTQTGRAFIDIAATVQKFKNIIPELLPTHALSGCDTVAMCHGIGKGRMLKAVKTGKCSLSLLGDVNANMKEITKQATAFLCMCYNNVPNEATMTEARIKVWLSKTGRKSASKVPKLCSLPPTIEAFQENVKRAHFQCAIWKTALQEPTHLDPTQYG